MWDSDAALAAEKLRLVEKVIQGRDFTCTIEGMNAIEAWLGSLPGHAYANVRQPPISTLNLAHMIPLSAVWAGAERDEHFGDAPLLYGKTEGSTPFRLSLHVGDVGHCLVVGPTGAGKSVLLATMAMQFRRYPGSQIFAFDFGGSIRAAALAMGGDWQDLGGALHDGKGGVALQPLARIDEASERSWAAEWLAALFAGEGMMIDPAAKEHLWSALTSLATAPVAERTLTGLAVLLQSRELKQALAPYLVGGPWGRLLDADEERIGAARVQAFETEGLVGAASAGPVLSYLFHRIAGRLDGSPNLNSLPTSTLGTLEAQVDQTRQLLARAEGIAFNVSDIQKGFEARYKGGALTGSAAEMIANAEARWKDSVGAFEDAMKVQAGIVTNMGGTRTSLSTIVGASQSATGALQAAQAGNQLLAIQSQQIADLAAVMSAQGRAEMLDAARAAAAEAEGRERFRRFRKGN